MHQTLQVCQKWRRFEFWDPIKKKWATGLKELGSSMYTIALIRLKMEWLDVNNDIHEYTRTFRQFWQVYDPYLDELIYKEVQEAKEKGFKALALTDEGVLHGSYHFVHTCERYGIKPIVGIKWNPNKNVVAIPPKVDIEYFDSFYSLVLVC